MTRAEWAASIDADPIAAYGRAVGRPNWGALLNVPEHLRGGLARYLILGVPPGSFLQAVLSNDLMESFARADEDSHAGMFRLCGFLHNAAPRGAYRGPAHYAGWIAQGGLVGPDATNPEEPTPC